MVDWPSNLPQAFSGDGSYQESPENTVLRSTMDAGITKIRRRQTRSESRVSGTMKLSAAQAAQFVYFFQVTTKGGALTFGGWLTRSGTRQQYQFAEEPTIQHLGGDTYEVGIKLKVMPEGTSTEPPGDPGGPVGQDPTGRSIPIAHAVTHKSGGTDQIRLDELAQPLDLLSLNASTSAHGLLPKLSGNATNYLNGQGEWSTPAGGSAGGGQAFTTIASPGVASVSADQAGDTLTIEGYNGISIATTPATDTITLSPVYGTTFGSVCQGNDVRLTNARTPVSHASEHKSGGSDPIPLDELGPPSDSTLLNASTAKHGLLPKLSGSSTQYLSGTGVWSNPESTQSFGINIRTYGAIGNGIADDTAAIQAAIDAGSATGDAVFIPAGEWRTTGTLIIKERVTLYGVGCSPYSNGAQGVRGKGSWLYFDHSVLGIYVRNTTDGGVMGGIVLRDFGTRRNQPTPTSAAWVPNDHDFDISQYNCDLLIQNVMLWNATRGYRLQQGNYGRVTIDGLRGHVFKMGIHLEETYDLPRIDNVHFWPFWIDNYAWVNAYTVQNLVGILVNRSDGLHLNSFFIICAWIGIRYVATSIGTHLRGQYENIYIDLSICPILIESGNNGVSFQASNVTLTCNVIGQFGSAPAGIYGIWIKGNNSRVDISNLESAFSGETCIRVEGTGNVVNVGRFRATGWNWNNVGAACVSVAAGNTVNFGTTPLLEDGHGGPQYVGPGIINIPRSTAIIELFPLGGGANDAPQIQAAVNALTGGGVIRLSQGEFRIGSGIVINNAITIQGAGWREGPTPGAGTWLSIISTGFTPFTIQGLEGRGTVIRDLAVWQSHGWGSGLPTDYDYVFKVLECYGGVEFINVLLCAINRGIFALTSGRMLFNKVYGDIYTVGVNIENALDTVRFDNCHFWPFAGGTASVYAYKQANGNVIELGRADGVFFSNFFALGYNSAIACLGSVAYGSHVSVYLDSFYADFVTYGIFFGPNATASTLLASNMNTQHERYIGYSPAGTPVPASAAIRVDCGDVTIRVSNLHVERCDTSAIRCNGTDIRISLGTITVNRYSQGVTTDPLIYFYSPSTSPLTIANAPVLLGNKPTLNYFRLTPSQNGEGQVSMFAEGTDDNCDIALYPKGTSGRVRFGSRVASGDAAITGYIEVKDAGGTLRRLAVIG